jgi:cell fate regulator YaaT (PSP1 superfamily)
MSVRSVRQMNDSPDGAPAGAAEPATEPPHSWLAALRARLGLPGAPTLRAMIEDALKGANDGRAFSAEERPDTRGLQTDLGERLKRRVDIRQVGPREQGRLCGAVGLCGTNQLCSARYPCHDQPITLRMAKDQQLPMNPGRITGLCGRLRCCLAFEHPLYRSFRDRAPAVGRTVATPGGKGIVRSYEVLRDACVVEMDGRTMMEVKLDEVVEVAG